jgi:penicillin G amidase
MTTVGPVVEDALRRAGTAPFFLGLASPVTAPLEPRAGSNAWVVTGARSATSAPLLANDPHRALAHPSLRYLIHLNAPGWNVIGAASPWLPGVVIGHNEHVAWGMTAFPADVVDIFVERVDPSNPHRVELGGRWVDTTIVHDPIKMKGQAKPFPFEREYTPNGVIVATDSERHLAYTVRWSGSEPGAAGELAALALDRARSAAEFRAALSRWKLPVAEVVFADADGLAGRQVAGLVPHRRGWDGALPVPGWSGLYDWQGWLRPDDLRHAMLPRPGGFFVSANQNAARTNRLVDVLEQNQVQTVEGFEHLQQDTTSWNAGQLVPLLAPLLASRNDVEAARQRLLQWDRRVSADSTDAALYVFWEEALARLLAERHLGPDLLNDYLARAVLPITALIKPAAAWFDGEPSAARDRLLLDGLAIAADRLRAANPKKDPSAWGDLHTLTFKHPLAITRAARERFNFGPLALSGYSGTVLSTSPVRDVAAGASFREIVDVSDWDRSVWTQAPGQSGEPGSPHFADLARPWSMAEYFQMAFSAAAVEASTEATLILRPR